MDEAGRMGIEHCAALRSCVQEDLFFVTEDPEWVAVDLKGVRVERTRRLVAGTDAGAAA
jgi:hypothetical protein